MGEKAKDLAILWLSFSLAAFVITGSIFGLFTPGLYQRETDNWQAQSIGQDLIDLFLVVPSLITAALLTTRKTGKVLFIWGGVVIYLLYTFIIYSFFVHFNKLFLIYCISLGLSFYSILWFVYRITRMKLTVQNFCDVPNRFTGTFFIVIALFFYFLWLSEVVPAILNNKIPKSVAVTGLATNPVHVLDISVFLPFIFITGIFLLKRKIIGYIMAPVFLSFFILMNITIGLLVVVMKQRGIEADYMLTIIMGALTIACIVLLIRFLKKIKLGL